MVCTRSVLFFSVSTLSKTRWLGEGMGLEIRERKGGKRKNGEKVRKKRGEEGKREMVDMKGEEKVGAVSFTVKLLLN